MKVAGVMVHAGLIETEQNTSVRGGFRALLRDIISSLNLPTPAGYLHYTRILLLCLLFLHFFRLRKGFVVSAASQQCNSNPTSQVLCSHDAFQPVFFFH